MVLHQHELVGFIGRREALDLGIGDLRGVRALNPLYHRRDLRRIRRVKESVARNLDIAEEHCFAIGDAGNLSFDGRCGPALARARGGKGVPYAQQESKSFEIETAGPDPPFVTRRWRTRGES